MLEEELRSYEELEAENAALQSELKRIEYDKERLTLQLEKLKRMLFGRSSEKLPPRDDGLIQADLFAEVKHEIQVDEPEEIEELQRERKKRRAKRKPIPKNLHREDVEVDVDPELKVCPDCGEEMQCFGHDTSEELEYLPALLYVVRYLLKKYACKKCQSGVVQAAVPPRPIPRGRPGPGLLAYLLVSKYQDHLPLNRLERIFARHGMEISRKTLCDWVQASGDLLRPIVESMKRDLLDSPLLQADETPVEAKDPEVKGKTRTCWLWTYGRPGAEVVFDFSSGRSTASPWEFLGDFNGYLQSDSYSVYKSLEKKGKTVHIGCWSHARRRFFEARNEQPKFSKLVLAAIQSLFRYERVWKEDGIEGEALVELRRARSLPLLERIKILIEQKQPQLRPTSGLGEAVGYALRHWEALTRYVEVPEAEVHNNWAENSLRGIALGRKNWLFVGHPGAGPRAAVILSLIETCRRLDIEPMAYLRSVLSTLTRTPERAAELTPRKWLESQLSKAGKPAE